MRLLQVDLTRRAVPIKIEKHEGQFLQKQLLKFTFQFNIF